MRPTGKQLHSWVWTLPAQKLAGLLGISDSALGKMCRRLGIPKPARGYWRKLEVGEPVQIEPLPAGDFERETRLAVDDSVPDQIQSMSRQMAAKSTGHASRPTATKRMRVHPTRKDTPKSQVGASSEVLPAVNSQNSGRSHRLQDSCDIQEMLHFVEHVLEYEAMLGQLDDLPSGLQLSPAGHAVLALILRSVSDRLRAAHPLHSLAKICEGIADGSQNPAWWTAVIKKPN